MFPSSRSSNSDNLFLSSSLKVFFTSGCLSLCTAKAFDSVHRESLWKLLRLYKLPSKIIDVIRILHEGFQCSVVVDNGQTDWFPVTSGLKQGCMLSPLLFLVTIDWVMRETNRDQDRGIRWRMEDKLDDLDYADDLCLISSTHQHIQEKTTKLNETSRSLGLNINRKKTKVMRINTRKHQHYASKWRATARRRHLHVLVPGKHCGNIRRYWRGHYIENQQDPSCIRHLKPVWTSSQMTIMRKLKIFNSNVKSVLLL